MKCFICEKEMKKAQEYKYIHKWKCECGATYIKYVNEGTNYYVGKPVPKKKKGKKK